MTPTDDVQVKEKKKCCKILKQQCLSGYLDKKQILNTNIKNSSFILKCNNCYHIDVIHTELYSIKYAHVMFNTRSKIISCS